jgi:hypothetical protein
MRGETMAKPTQTITGVSADQVDQIIAAFKADKAENVEKKDETGGTYTLVVTFPEGTVLADD